MTDGELEGIDVSELTAREQREWWTHVTELLAPCPDQPVSVAQCVHEARPCVACAPAAEFLKEEVTLGKTRTQIEAAFALRFDHDAVKSVKIDGAPAKGPANAVVTIVEWADFQCPFCAMAAPYLDYLAKAYPDHVRVVFKYFPISYHEQAIPASRAAVAAFRQGKFWEMHAELFRNREDLGDAVLERIAGELKLDLERFRVDLAAQSTQSVIERDRREADDLGLRGTPMIYVNGRYFDLLHFDLMRDMQPWIELEIEMATGQKVKPKVAPPRWEAGLTEATPAEGAPQ